MRQLSDLGPIPSEWSIRQLSGVCSMRTGGTPPKNDVSLWSGEVPWVSGKDLKSVRLSDSIDHITRDAAETHSKIAPAGSVLVLVRGMGLANGFALSLIDRPMAFNQDLRALVPNPDVSGAFLMHALTFASQRMLRNVTNAAHGTMRLSKDDLDGFELPIPPHPEQLTIAEVLDRARVAVDVEQRCLQRVQALKRATMRDVFTFGLRGERHRQTDFGATPDSWPLVPIGSFATRTQYGLSLRGEAQGACPILRMNCQENGKVVMRNLQFVTLERRTLEDFRIQPGDILFNRTNSYELVGRTAIVENNIEAVFASYLVRLSVDPTRIDSRFLNYFLNWEVTQVELKKLASRAVGQANINASKLRGFAVPVPPDLDEQREIVTILDAIDRKVHLHKRKRAVLEALFKALLHKLMTGEIRVSDLDLSALQTSTAGEAMS